MQITRGRFFGKIIPSCDAHSAKTFYRYYIGRLSGELLFDGAAGDEKDAVETVTAHLKMLMSRLRSDNKSKHTISPLLGKEQAGVRPLHEDGRS